MQPYAPELEQTMRQFYDSLSEKDRRRYAGVEALKLGPGGRNYIARILGCSRRTVTKGAKEISGWPGREVDQRLGEPTQAPAVAARIRQAGGGRKPYTADTPAAILIKQVNEPLPRPSQFVADLPEAVEKVLLKIAAKTLRVRCVEHDVVIHVKHLGPPPWCGSESGLGNQRRKE
jgi:hypothetical protein